MRLTRRQLLGLSLGSVATLASGIVYLQDESMSPAPAKDGQLLTDLHCHPGNTYSQQDLVAMLSSPGLVGLTFFKSESSDKLFTYEQAVKLPGVQEIDRGLLARIESSGSIGYFTKSSLCYSRS